MNDKGCVGSGLVVVVVAVWFLIQAKQVQTMHIQSRVVMLCLAMLAGCVQQQSLCCKWLTNDN